MKKNFFLSHSGDIKKKIVKPLATSLLSKGKSIWLDEAELTIGDSLVEEIQSALVNSDFVVVFISKSFLQKGWPLEELNTVINIQISSKKKRILPILIDISHSDLETNFPFLSEKIYLTWNDNPDEIADELIKAFNKSHIIHEGLQNNLNANLDSKKFNQLLEMVYIILRIDQITNSDPFIPEISQNLLNFEGGWSKSLIVSMKELCKINPSDLIKWQGGITTSALVGNSLLQFEKRYFQIHSIKKLDYIYRARNALLNTQHATGGFGALVQTRDGIEPHPTYRHTSASLSFLLNVHPPIQVIKSSLRYLQKFFDVIKNNEPIEDTCPALALSWLFKTAELACENGFLSTKFRDEIASKLLLTLSQIDDEYYPYWKPYANNKKLSCWTSLTVITICPQLFSIKQGNERITLIIKDIFESLIQNCLPTYKGYQFPDIGMTALFAYALSLLKSESIKFTNVHFSDYSNKVDLLLNNIIELQYDFKSFKNIWSERLYPILQLGLRNNLSSNELIRYDLDNKIRMILTSSDWRNGIIKIPNELDSSYPLLQRIIKFICNTYKD